jgi:protein O-GlcNAc transferase
MVREEFAMTADRPENLFDRAFTQHQAGQWQEAEVLYREILRSDPMDGDALQLLGLVRCQLGSKEEAIELLERAASINPKAADCHYHLGVVLNSTGRFEESIKAFQRAVDLKPDFVDAYQQLGLALRAKGDWEPALSNMQKAVDLQPNSVDLLLVLGITQSAVGRSHDAADTFRRVLAMEPDQVDALNNLGNALLVEGELGDSVAAFEKAISVRPDFFLAHNNLGNVLKEMGKADEAIAQFRAALALKPFAGFHGNLLYTMHLSPKFDADEIFREHIRWNNLYAKPLEGEIRPHDNDRSPGRRLKIGYVSCDFREHSIAYFLENLLSHHDPNWVESICYSDVAVDDAMTQRLKNAAHQWKSILGLPDAKVADMIRQDKIDILVDLGGHTGGNRLLIFARKPAPVQVTYLGYPDTTGLSAMDYRVTDPFSDPQGQTEAFHSERLMRLPSGFLCYRPPEHAPAVNELPALSSGKITFGSFNNLAKISDLAIEMWSGILKGMPSSRLLIKSRGLSDRLAQDYLLQRFSKQGISSDRLELRGRTPNLENHLEQYHEIDIALDTFPYHGTTTTCEALWMGVPVITLAGKTHVGRVGVSLLSMMGMKDSIAKDEQDYVKKAVDLAKDLDRLKKIRPQLRQKMSRSTLLDASGHTRAVEAAYRQMWEKWVGDVSSSGR